MERLNEKHLAASNALKRLGEVITLYQQRYDKLDDVEKQVYVGGVVQHFEFSYETLWKFIKFYLLKTYGTETMGSKDVFRALRTHQLIDDELLGTLLSMVDVRNVTTHTYDEEFAKALCIDIVELYPAMKQALDAVSLDLTK